MFFIIIAIIIWTNPLCSQSQCAQFAVVWYLNSKHCWELYLFTLLCTSVRKWDIFFQSRGSTGRPHFGRIEWILPISAAINLQRENIFSDEPGWRCYCTNNYYQRRNTTPFPFSTLILFLFKEKKKKSALHLCPFDHLSARSWDILLVT